MSKRLILWCHKKWFITLWERALSLTTAIEKETKRKKVREKEEIYRLYKLWWPKKPPPPLPSKLYQFTGAATGFHPGGGGARFLVIWNYENGNKKFHAQILYFHARSALILTRSVFLFFIRPPWAFFAHPWPNFATFFVPNTQLS